MRKTSFQSLSESYYIVCFRHYCQTAKPANMEDVRGYRKNSLVIDFSTLPAKPSVPEVQKFIFECLKIDITKIKNLQLSMTKSYVFLEMETSALAEQLVNENSRKFSIAHDGKDYTIPLFIADGAIEVKVHDLPPYMPNTTIAKYLAPYGDILSIRNDTWHDFFPGIPNGIRIVRMKIKKAIPSYISFEDETAYIRYRSQQPTCRHCARNLHVGQKCSEVKKALTSSVNSRLTLASILQGMNPDMPTKKQIQPQQQTAEEMLILDPAAPESETHAEKSYCTPMDHNPALEPTHTGTVGFEISDGEEAVMITDYTDNPQNQQHNSNAVHSAPLDEKWHEVTAKRPASPKGSDKNKAKRSSRSTSKNKFLSASTN